MEPAKRFSVHHRPDQPIDGVVRSAIVTAREFGEGARLEPAAAARLAVVVDELVGNLLRHGRPGCDVHLDMVLTRGQGEREVLLVLEDDCVPFDPREVAFNGPDEEDGGGVGLALVRAFAEIAGYERRDGVNRLTLRLRDQGAKADR